MHDFQEVIIIMITINFYKDGAYIKGHDIKEVCSVISYAMWSCVNDCLEANENVHHYQSHIDEIWRDLGFTYIQIDLDVEEHRKIFNNFKANLWNWVDELYPQVKIIDNEDEFINWNNALKDAKQEQGI
jgi:hypothetical protein